MSDQKVFMTLGVNVSKRMAVGIGFGLDREDALAEAEARLREVGMTGYTIEAFQVLGDGRPDFHRSLALWLADAGMVGVQITDSIQKICAGLSVALDEFKETKNEENHL